MKSEKKFFRNCPKCGIEIGHTSKNNCQKAKKKLTLCSRCAYFIRDQCGGKNPFYGKRHKQKSIEEMSDAAFNRIYTKDQKDQARNQLIKVVNKRPIYDIWLEKYGKEEANKRLDSFRKKQSDNNKGEKNHMFGKPAPQGSGNGWSGWYNGWFFRSLRELSYMIKVLEGLGLKWKTPDKSFKIQYKDYKGQSRTYFPDFIVENTKLVEIKPAKLHNTPKVLAKKKAAEEYCKYHNMIYEILDPPLLTNDEIIKLHTDGKIRFLDRYEQKFKDRYI